MRHSARALVSGLLIACFYGPASAAEGTRARWWPFGAEETTPADAPLVSNTPAVGTIAPSLGNPPAASTSAPSAADFSATSPASQQPPLTDYSSDTLPERRWMLDSPFGKVSWPRIHFPEIPKPQLPRPQFWTRKSQVDEARNAWVEESPDPARPSPLQAVRQGARRVGDSTRSALRKTVDVLTPGDDSNSESSRIARRETRPPFWKRMFTTEEPQPEGPRTVTEWMAQDRLDP